MKKSISLKLIKEELYKEIKVNKPTETYRINSPEFKRFFELIELCDYWGVDINPEGSIRFPLNNFDFFYMLYTSGLGENWNPDECIVDRDGFEIIKANWGLDNNDEYTDDKIKELKNKLKEHST
jgi:hypothetical protein